MRILAAFLALALFAPYANGQKPKNIEAIELNSKFTLELTSEDSDNYGYNIISTESFEDEIKMSSAFKLLDEKLERNQIQGILAIGTFGSQRSVLLVIKSGLEFPLQYELLIDIKGKSKFKKTSTMDLIPGIPTTEIWPHNIHAIKIGSFQKSKIITETEAEIDTACYSVIDTDQGNLLLTKQLSMAINLISSSEENERVSVEQFENTVQSKIQLKEWGWLDHPISRSRKIKHSDIYEIIECPYFERDAAYYFTKKKDDLKLITLSWGPRWSGGWQPKLTEDVLTEFRTKYDILMKSVSKTLGSPTINNAKEDSTRFNAEWQTSDGINAKASLSLGKYSYLLRFYIYKEN